MPGNENIKRSAVFAIVFVLIFAPIDFASLSSATFAEEDGLVISTSTEWSGVKTLSGFVSVKSGATLTIRKGTVIEFDGVSTLEARGKLVIEGTPEHPVVIRRKDNDEGDRYAITAVSNGTITTRNAIVSGGGSAEESFLIGKHRSFLRHADAAWFYTGAFGALSGGTLDVEGVWFHDNPLAVYTDQNSANQVKVWRSRFSENSLDFVNNGASVQSRLQYNWWGSENGPAPCVTECGEYYPRPYQKIIGKANITDWAKEEYFRDPVIVIPGIMGSWKMTEKSELELNPIPTLRTYDDLIETLRENGYEEGKNLLPFPYEWRMSNVVTANLLKDKIAEIKTTIKWPKVDIVAHSMGGLVARQYIAQAFGNADNIDQLITLGTPHDGAPKSYLQWEAGEFGQKFGDNLLEKIFQQEAEENGYETIFDYIRRVPIQSVRELLPAYSYLKNEDGGDMRSYPDIYPRNTFLETLKTSASLSRLSSVAFTNIVGKTGDDETISTLRVDEPSIALLDDPEAIALWGHGEPDGYSDLLGGDRGLELGVGDGTVPLGSAKGIVSDETIELASGHGDLPSDAADVVYKTLTGLDTTANIVETSRPTSLLLIQVFSPVDIQVISPSGKRTGKNFSPENDDGLFYDEIPDAYYTGFDTKSEFIAIPDPEDGVYQILTQGTGEGGSYRIELAKISEDAFGDAKESTATIMGEAVAEVVKEELPVEVSETDIILKENDIVAPTTTAVLYGAEGTSGWYVGDVTVTLATMDNDGGSGVAKTEYSLDAGTTWQTYTGPVFITDEGVTSLRYASTDHQGNREEDKILEVKIDKTAPEARISFDPKTQKLDIQGIDAGSGGISVAMTHSTVVIPAIEPESRKSDHQILGWLRNITKHWIPDQVWDDREKKIQTIATLTDEAGHKTELVFEKKKDKDRRIDLVLVSVSYDGVKTTLTDARMQYRWLLDWRKREYRIFASYMRSGDSKLESHYIHRQDETWIMERARELGDDDGDDDADRRSKRMKLPGMVVPYLETVEGELKMKYEI